MSSDLDLQAQQEESEEQKRWQKAREAATLVIAGKSREGAVEKIKSVYLFQSDPSESEVSWDEDGAPIFHLKEAQPPIVPEDRKTRAQIEAIARDLVDRFE
ncbi:hypothetical protein [Pseudomonas fulva]|uniref:hypothetical protein n=1 Tax=Pseudomonas fulva TaxID=47880 RepID=UPI0028D168CC|nr:hypothetical protein [uncultured Pseudomonas sp.]